MDHSENDSGAQSRNSIRVLKFALAKIPLLVGAAVCMLIIGEAHARLPFVHHQLEYLPDRDIVGLFRPDQTGYDWIARGSVRTPIVRINSEGHRGPETDWNEPVLLALGSSEAFGLGVGDTEVWTHVLEGNLRAGGRDWEVVNAAGMGFGAYHQAAVMDRVLNHHTPGAVVVSLSIGERFFEPIPESERDAKFAAAERRREIKKVTKFLPFLYRKIKAQLPPAPATVPSGAEVGEFMVQKDQAYWAHMIEAARERSVPILFVVRDPWGYESSRVLEESLLSLTASYDKASVVRIGSDAFGMEQFSVALREQHYYREFTLVIDPHANAQQHQILGNSVADVIAGVLDEQTNGRQPNTLAEAGGASATVQLTGRSGVSDFGEPQE